VGTEGKVIAVALENGDLQCYSLQSRNLLLSLHHTEALNTCCFVSENVIVTGSQDGTILLADIRTPRLVNKSNAGVSWFRRQNADHLFVDLFPNVHK